MADSVTTSSQVQLDLTLSRANSADVSRKLTFDILNDSIKADIKEAITNNFLPSLVGGGLSTFIQPSGWRDNDETEEEYVCKVVEAKIITKSEISLDLS